MDENMSTGILSTAMQSGGQKTGEFFADRALNGLVDFVKKKYGEAQVLLETAFSRYLENASLRYNQVKTLATGAAPRTIIGAGNVYVSVGVEYEKQRIDTDTVDSMLNIGKNILILGTGGIGKSMMMRYLFLNTANRGEYVPVLLELRKISNQPSGQVSILDLIYSCMSDFDVNLPRDQFEYSLRLGKYLFLMDGFDEIKESQAAETAAAIQNFCAKYPKNSCIVTSRPRQNTAPLETFTILKSLPLTKEQAVTLASKIWEEDEKTREFCKQLEDELYEKHQDFAENPLLLSMMFLTFMRNNSVPNHLAEFYSKAYDALYSAHDSNDKGYYRREFQCNNIDESGFKLVLSHFCFQSYFKEDYEFRRDDLLSYIDKSIQKMGVDQICANAFLEDLQNVVCIIVKDGDIYRFSHRSFQAYFAACYTSTVLTDEQQKKLFSSLLSGDEVIWDKDDYYELLSQLAPKRFVVNALEDQLRLIREEVNSQPCPDTYLFRLQFRGISIEGEGPIESGIGFYLKKEDGGYRYFNVVRLFRQYVAAIHRNEEEPVLEFIRICAKKVQEKDGPILFEAIDSSDVLSTQERDKFYSALAQIDRAAETRTAIDRWLLQIEKERKLLLSDDFIDDL